MLPAFAAGKGEPLACERVSSPRIPSPDPAHPARGPRVVRLRIPGFRVYGFSVVRFQDSGFWGLGFGRVKIRGRGQF